MVSCPPTPCCLGGREGAREHLVVQLRRQLAVGGDGVRDEQRRDDAERVARARDRGDLGGGVDRVLDVVTGVGDVEARVVGRAVADDGEIERLEALERERDVEDRLDAGAHHDEGEGGQGAEVGGLVEGLLRAAVDAAETAGREDPDARAMGEMRGRRDGGAGAQALDRRDRRDRAGSP